MLAHLTTLLSMRFRNQVAWYELVYTGSPELVVMCVHPLSHLVMSLLLTYCEVFDQHSHWSVSCCVCTFSM